MSEKTKILVVDDDLFMRKMLAEALGETYQVIDAEHGSDALKLAQEELPGLILLDVEMPIMDGYEACIKLRQSDSLADIPVIFISALDQIDERLKGYEVGGNDYVVKPFSPQELKAKVAHLLNLFAERKQLKEMASYATNTAMTAMTSMSEMGALLETLKSFNASTHDKTLADAVIAGLTRYGLHGVVQVVTPLRSLYLSEQGEASPLEVSVINHMSTMERIFQFKTRMFIRYPSISILVNNMPVEDPDRCGRLRDHLAMLVEGAQMRITGINAENESGHRGVTIDKMIERVTGTLNEIDMFQRQNRMETRLTITAMTEEMVKILQNLQLTDDQEKNVISMVSNSIEKIIDAQSAETNLQNKLSTLVQELKSISAT